MISLAVWSAHSMPVVIEGKIGYHVEDVAIRGGTRRYVYLKVGLIGLELALTFGKK